MLGGVVGRNVGLLGVRVGLLVTTVGACGSNRTAV